MYAVEVEDVVVDSTRIGFVAGVILLMEDGGRWSVVWV